MTKRNAENESDPREKALVTNYPEGHANLDSHAICRKCGALWGRELL